MTTLMENDLPVSLVMKAIDGPLIVPRKSPGPYGVEVSIERVTWNGSGQSALLADPCDVRIGSRAAVQVDCAPGWFEALRVAQLQTLRPAGFNALRSYPADGQSRCESVTQAR